MILTCEHCGTSYRLDETLIQPSGSKVRCSTCKRLWVVEPPRDADRERELPQPAPADAGEAGVLSATGFGAATAGMAGLDTTPKASELGLEDLDISGLGIDEFNREEIFQTDELSFDELENMLDDERGADEYRFSPPEEEITDSGLVIPEIEASLSSESEGDDAVVDSPDDLSLEELERMLEAEGGLLDESASADEPRLQDAPHSVGENTTEDEISLAELDFEDAEGPESLGRETEEDDDLILDLPDVTEESEGEGQDVAAALSGEDDFSDLELLFGETEIDHEDTSIDELTVNDLQQIPGEASPGILDEDDVEYIDLDKESETGSVADHAAVGEDGERAAPEDLIFEPDELGVTEVEEEDGSESWNVDRPDDEMTSDTDEPGREGGELELRFDLDEAEFSESEPESLEEDDEAASGFEADSDLELEIDPELRDILGDDDPDVRIEETEEIDRESLLGDLPGDGGADIGAGAESSESDFTLELSPELEDLFGDLKEEETPPEETEELDLSTITTQSEPVEVSAEGEEAPFELDLDLISGEDDGDPSSDEVPSTASAEELMDLKLELDPADDDDTRELDFDFPDAADDLNDLTMNLDYGEETGEAEEDSTRELDLSTLESMLGADAADNGSETKQPVEDSDSLELDLNLDDLPDDTDDPDEEATRELDFKDIERMLEEGSETPSGAVEASHGDLELELEEDLELEDGEGKAESETPEPSEDQIDLTEIERLLDIEDATDKTLAPREEIDDLELDLDLSSSVDEDLDLELNFDLHDDEEEAPSTLFDTSESEELNLDLELSVDEDEASRQGLEKDNDLEFEVLEEMGASDGQNPVAAGAAASAAAVAAAPGQNRQAGNDEEVEYKPQAAVRKPVPPASQPGRGARMPLLILLLLVLLAGGVYYVTQYTDIQIPYVSEMLGAKTAGAVAPVDSSLKGYFVENAPEGQLYVIEGRVLNDTGTPVSLVEVTGRVFANEKRFQRAAKAYCDNVIPREELQKLTLAEIQGRLGNRVGVNRANSRIAAGGEIPFMVVFGSLPGQIQLEEFSVEVTNSIPLR
ncbi:MAG: zinc-ribbon domain-containing protein [Desulfobacterales bacterium]